MFDVTWLIWRADERNQDILREVEAARGARAAAQPQLSRVRLAALLRMLAARLDGAPATERRIFGAS